MRFRKITALVILSLLALCTLFGTTYNITDYDFIVDGQTKRWALSNRVKGTNESFDSLSELEAALKAKRQKLWNMNIFSTVKVSWEEIESYGDVVNGRALVVVEDNGTYLILPYPKYDSNTGFSLGLRYKNNNVLGTLGTASAAFDWKQNASSGFDKSTFEFDIPTEEVLLANGSLLSFELSGKINTAHPEEGKLELSAELENLKVKDIVFDINSDVEYLYGEKMFNAFESGVSAKGISIGKMLLDASFSANLYFSNKEGRKVSDSGITSSLSLRKIEMGNLTVSDKISFEMYHKDGTTEFEKLLPERITNTASFGIKSEKIKNLTVSTEFSHYYVGTDYNDYWKAVFSFSPFKDIKSSSAVKGYTKAGAGFNNLEISETLSASYKVFDKKFTVSPSLAIKNFNKVSYADVGTRVWIIEPSVSISGGAIDRVSSDEDYYAFRDNFRTGYNAQAEIKMSARDDSPADIIFRTALTAFFMPNKVFNPSVRILAAAAADKIQWFKNSSSSSYAQASTYSFAGYDMTQDTLNDLVRGVRRDDPDIENPASSKYMAYFSTNLTTGILYFEDFAHLYVSPFLDAVIYTDDFKEFKTLSGVGVEAYLIMDSHSSYPIRASLGFDLEDLVNKLKGGEGHLDYEIFIGLNLLY